MEVFLSYTWDPKTGEAVPGYEEPVDRIFEMLEKMPGVDPIRDRKKMEDNDSIVGFMEKAGECPMVVMIQSDKYWKSPNCGYEVYSLDRSWKHRHETFKEVLISVEHVPDHDAVDPFIREKGLSKQSAIEHLKEFWAETPLDPEAKFEGVLSTEEMRKEAVRLISDYIKLGDDRLN